jgi:hypothetical protein
MRGNMVRAFVWLLVCAALVASAGCASESKKELVEAPVVEQVAPPPEAYYTHTVKWPGESISIIAGWYTGDVQNWKALAEANPDINPNKIHEGMKIRIPESLVKNRTAMTKEHVDSFYPKPRKQPPARTGTGQGKDDEPQLFGPKEYPQK